MIQLRSKQIGLCSFERLFTNHARIGQVAWEGHAPLKGAERRKLPLGMMTMDNIGKNKLLYLMKNMQLVNLTEKEILNTISKLLSNYTNEMTTCEMGFIIHTFCKLKFAKYSLCTKIVKSIMSRKPVFNDMRTLTQLLIDLHRMGSIDFNIITFLTQHYVRGSLRMFSLFDLSMILYVYNKHGYNDRETVREICAVIEGFFMPIVSQDKGVLTTILLSLSMLQLNRDLYTNLLHQHVLKKYNQFEAKYLCNIVYSVALWLVGDCEQVDLLKGESNQLLRDPSIDVLQEVLRDVTELLLQNVNVLKNEELKQIHIVLYLLRELGGDYEQAINVIERKKIKNTLTVSKMQKQLEKLLKEMGLKADREFPVGPYVLDFVLQKKRTCIEVNGFTHYYTFGGELNAKSRLKYYILRRLNWKVLTVEYTSWKNKSKEDKMEYLEKNVLSRIG
ncbi:RAP protein [Plasmodium cynomolgi strain B]|uniref:RAP protein n=1 Tax=Plasmodium cynomolgi (strain B) TaxID=1120755 RepID=K6V8H8_PLACD|nr:RAP protein [Plasmodium cynomolgi strain B]GAB65457.1 RAP protein [Plasmodium cynomolgi strain B]